MGEVRRAIKFNFGGFFFIKQAAHTLIWHSMCSASAAELEAAREQTAFNSKVLEIFLLSKLQNPVLELQIWKVRC